MKAPLLADPRLWGWLAILAALVALVHVLSPILAPFLAGAILAYVLNPLVSRISGRHVRRSFAVMLVLAALVLLVVAFLLVVLPLFYKELRLLAERLPGLVGWMNEHAAPWLAQHAGLDVKFDLDTLKEMAADALQSNQDLIGKLLGSAHIGGVALLGILVNVLMIPVVLYYLLRDWYGIVERIASLIPRRLRGRAGAIAGEIDAVLAEFLRGQLMVMLVMGVYYVVVLWLLQLDFALPIGLITGLLVFIPFVGSTTGFVLASIAALLQFGVGANLVWVWVAIGAGQALEGMVVTPLLVGERIGLHPVAVIFALLAFGQVFGFFGVLLALPASAALLVALRHLRAAYLASPLYGEPR